MKNKANISKEVVVNGGNWLGAINFGSFASVDQNTTVTVPQKPCQYYLSLEIGESCQLNCRHCIYHQRKAQGPAPQKAILDNVIHSLDNGFDPIWVSLAGKEPTFYGKTLTNVAAKTKRPKRQNIIMTNGLKLKDALLEELADNVDYFDISLDGTKEAHDWMRGPGRFERTWDNIKEVLTTTQCNIGVISTAVKATLQNGQPQFMNIADLAQMLAMEYGKNHRISLSVSLYYGWPDDPMLLGAEEIASLALCLSEIDFPTRLLVTANYSSVFPEVVRKLGIKDYQLEFDPETCLPVMRFGNTSFIIFNLIKTPQVGLRVANHGSVYLGCDHLVLGDDAEPFKIADLNHDSLQEVVVQLQNHEVDLLNQMMQFPTDCHNCPDFALCGGGDRISGIYFNDRPADPFCHHVH
jgi:radical SAM protein with 4Fe4S-binding SPASM domain